MSTSEVILKKQKEYFESGATLPQKHRVMALKRLYSSIRLNEKKIEKALKADLGKGRMEGFMCETGLVLNEISHMLSNIRRYAAPKAVPTPLTNFHSKSVIYMVPKGNVLIMSPWNYPFLLTMSPLVDAVAAGNTVIVKPSAYAPNTSEVIDEIIGSTFPERFVAVVTGGRKENSELLELGFDHIFFTGSQAVGREVMRHAAENLTPVTLELGGKSPCIVDRTAKLALSARRIVFAKFLNCGQTCVAPDYILCESSVKDEFTELLKKEIRRQFGAAPLENNEYGKIINEKHFNRLLGLMNDEKVVYGGKYDSDALRIEPTVMDDVSWDDAVMQEEIFGPLLPILTFDDISEVRKTVNAHAHPLALYIFSRNRKNIRFLRERVRFGGGCVNDAVVHLATPNMPFGGFRESGMGAYHGRFGFETFSHKCSILDKKTWIDLPMRYQPYNRLYEGMLRMFLR